MKMLLRGGGWLGVGATVAQAQAAEAGAPANWHATTLPAAIGYMVLFAAIGILLALVAYKVFDKFTPGDLHREIIENRNVAAAVLGGAIILGVCIIIAASMLG